MIPIPVTCKVFGEKFVARRRKRQIYFPYFRKQVTRMCHAHFDAHKTHKSVAPAV